jgi:hypothetical protein
MKRLITWVFVLALLAGALYGASYVGARARAGMLLGNKLPSLGTRQIAFAFDGAKDLAGHPRAWVISYGPTEIVGARQIKIFVSPTGTLLATLPRDLETRLKPYQDPTP